LPSQVPSRPQVVGSLFVQTDGERGRSPAATYEQVPGADVVLQDLQVSVQALVQQRPSTQKPLAQSLPQLQALPFVFGVLPAGEQFPPLPLPGVFE
jgi:hypothetical protein